MTGIYLIENPNGKIYIGQALDIEKRWKGYKKLNNCKSQPKIYNSLKKYGVENHNFHIAFECAEQDLNEEERFYQEIFDVIGKNGLNCRLTETEDKSGHFSDETRKNMSEAGKKRKPCSVETRKKLSAFAKKRKHSKETRKKISEENKGKIVSDESKKKNSDSHTGKIVSDETRKKLSEAHKGITPWNKGIKCSEETKKKISNTKKEKSLLIHREQI